MIDNIAGSMKRFIQWWWPTVIIISAILWLTMAPHPLPKDNIQLFPGADKLVHALMMGALAGTALYDFSRRGAWHIGSVSISVIISVGLAVILFSALDEWAQGAMGIGRSADIYDFLADIAGILIVCIIAILTIRAR